MNDKRTDSLTFGIISDTHSLLRPEVIDVLQGSDLILHAGDIGNQLVLDQLENIAPVIAVRGNMDGTWAHKLRKTEIIERNNMLIYIIHDRTSIDNDPVAASIKVVISGHTHRPSISRHNGILYINPGSAGPRRFSLPVSVAMLHLRDTSVDAEIVNLQVK